MVLRLCKCSHTHPSLSVSLWLSSRGLKRTKPSETSGLEPNVRSCQVGLIEIQPRSESWQHSFAQQATREAFDL